MDKSYSFYLSCRGQVWPPEVMVFACRLTFLISLTLAFAATSFPAGAIDTKQTKKKKRGSLRENLLGIPLASAAGGSGRIRRLDSEPH